ncbi:hypothetical protein [uncultured Helicobacter sp.]|uniref:hypothetical protein n=1 Tax=uncultured Helicobacter sp. TaxID=175537 RepID=UPI00260FF42F|nr:hypothetical protein [uncultured Helicobacter sp.]
MSKRQQAQVASGRIFDEKCGVQGKSQGSYLSGSDCGDFSQLPHLSQKANAKHTKSGF